MKNVTFFSTENGIFVNMSIWEGPIATWKAEEISFDERWAIRKTSDTLSTIYPIPIIEENG